MDDYKITGSPETIWLNYGDIDRDDTHEKCARDGEVTWCEEAVFYSDIKYVRADVAQAREAELMADNARLRIAGSKAHNAMRFAVAPNNAYTDALDELDAALAATPEQSLARLRNQVLEDAATRFDGYNGYAAKIIRAMKEPE